MLEFYQNCEDLQIMLKSEIYKKKKCSLYIIDNRFES